ncbi:hypothetical protein E3U23_03930 [Erythrobacter litoralis]|uniref:hypothetical protein n=1 Tax=Erythrobacter litoralis TaxID=39960 RepID=UPI002435151D|nr:hypothetical protein [Erythrobacter litoralis]MDG6078339.1 hypothetical protein [Erythrobacter litoralis]
MPDTDPDTQTDPRPALTDFAPVPRQRMRRGGWSAQRQRRFIELLAETGSVRAACRRMGVGEHHIYKLRRHPEADGFRKAWEAALDCGIARIEDVAMDRALNGVEEPVYHRGELVGTRRVYNDRLLMFLLRNRAADRFGEWRNAAAPGPGSTKDRAALEKQWHREWEAARNARAGEDEDAVIASIDAKLADMHARSLNAMSPRTRAAYDEYKRCEQEDKDTGYLCWDDPDHEAYTDRHAPFDDEDDGTPIPLPPPEWRKREVEESEAENPRWRRVKDEGWE